jgi:hypothetical protein
MTSRVQASVGLKAGGGRSFSVAYRLEFLRLWDECTVYGAKTRLLREHNLTRPTVQRWLDARDRGEFVASMTASTTTLVSTKSRNHMINEERAELRRLRKEVARLEKKVAQAEAAQEIMGKAYELLEGITTSSDDHREIPPALMSAEEYAAWLQRTKLS